MIANGKSLKIDNLHGLNQQLIKLIFLVKLPNLKNKELLKNQMRWVVLVINAVLEFDFGEHLGQGLRLIMSLTKVLADETGDLEV